MNLEILWPLDTKSGSFNENSLVIKLGNNNFQCLFAADLNKTAEQGLLSERLDLKANILKVGHHGYTDATSQEFLEAVAAQVAVISTGQKEKKPLDSTLDVLKKKNMRIYRTDTDGNIVVTIDKKGNYRIKTERQAQEK